jgi:hypothetical protein
MVLPGSASIRLFSFWMSAGLPVTHPPEQNGGLKDGPNALPQL